MKIVSLSRTVLFIIFLFSTTGAARAISLELAAGGDLVVSRQVGFEAKSQPGIVASFSAAFPIREIVGPGFSLFWANTWPTGMAGGYGYRGYWEIGIAAFILAQASIFSVEGVGNFRVGGKAGMSAAMAGYQYTTLSFFVPSVDLSPFFAFTPAGTSRWDFSVSAPVRIILRRDLSWSLSFGIVLGTDFNVGGGR